MHRAMHRVMRRAMHRAMYHVIPPVTRRVTRAAGRQGPCVCCAPPPSSCPRHLASVRCGTARRRRRKSEGRTPFVP
eukprot:scaffold105702_cov36-Phaeocystis_antarctica.AAC.1